MLGEPCPEGPLGGDAGIYPPCRDSGVMGPYGNPVQEYWGDRALRDPPAEVLGGCALQDPYTRVLGLPFSPPQSPEAFLGEGKGSL